MKIFTINNKTEEKFLRTKTANFDFSKHSKKDINELIKKMKETMLKTQGIGLSANQVGLNMNFFIAQIPKIEGDKIAGQKFYAIFNPQIIKISEETSIIEEGCLSIPETYGKVERPNKITLAGFDKIGRKIKIKTDGLAARVFQHEMDHLNGILFTDKAKEIHIINKNE